MFSMPGSRGRRGWAPRPRSGVDEANLNAATNVGVGGSPQVDRHKPQGVSSNFVCPGNVLVESTSSPQFERSILRGFALSARRKASIESTSSLQSEQSTSRGGNSGVRPLEVLKETNSTSADNQQGGRSSKEKVILDICCTTNKPMLNRSLLEKNREKRLQALSLQNGRQNRRLRPGMILLEKFLCQEDQIAIIKACRELGIGPGGFYKPGYDDGAKLRLHMMCLGKNWNPRTNEYESKRSVDGAVPPQIPDLFMNLVEKAMQASYDFIKQGKKQNAQNELPALLPDLCIVNFYNKSGKLGLHQDKDETSESLNNGLPVVSFSIGDSADFLYGDSRDEHTSECIMLESGDVLIFGGKSRLIFHGISKIHEDTAPKSLMDEASLSPGRLNLTFRQY